MYVQILCVPIVEVLCRYECCSGFRFNCCVSVSDVACFGSKSSFGLVCHRCLNWLSSPPKSQLLIVTVLSFTHFSPAISPANPPNSCGSLLLLRPTLLLYDLAMETPNFGGLLRVKIVGEVVRYVSLCMLLTLH